MKIRRFRSSAGFVILAGQDDASNDSLTLTGGHPNDIWLHAKGVPGSHVLLKCGEAKGDPDRMSLKEAAGVAAWFSKMRQGGKVSVSYCRVHQVSKTRGSKPGSVTIRQQQTVVVRPALPEEDNQE